MGRPHSLVIPGAADFVTVVIHDRQRLLVDAAACGIVLNALAFQRAQGKMRLFAYVVIPDHRHWVCVPATTHTAAGLVRDFKTFTAKEVRRHLEERHDSRALAAAA